jgi:hypothetical protein
MTRYDTVAHLITWRYSYWSNELPSKSWKLRICESWCWWIGSRNTITSTMKRMLLFSTHRGNCKSLREWVKSSTQTWWYYTVCKSGYWILRYWHEASACAPRPGTTRCVVMLQLSIGRSEWYSILHRPTSFFLLVLLLGTCWLYLSMIHRFQEVEYSSAKTC